MFDTESPLVPVPLPGGRQARDYLLFFAALPPARIARAASLAALQLRSRHRIAGQTLAEDRLHVSVQSVCTFTDTLPGHRLGQVLEIATELTPACTPVSLRFDRTGSMHRQAPTVLALKGDAASRREVGELTGPLSKALASYGFDEFAGDGGLPHMTLVPDTPWITDEKIDPIGWTVDRLVLLVSHLGCGHVQRVGTWPLRGAVEAEFLP